MVDPRTIVIKKPASEKPESNAEAALRWINFGFNVIPVVPGEKMTALKWDPWLEGLSSDKVKNHWSNNPTHDVGLIVGDDLIVFDLDSPESLSALNLIEAKFGIKPNMIVKTVDAH